MNKAFAYFTECYHVAILAGACETKARYFANKETFKELGCNIFEKLGMTKRSVPTKDELLYAICESDGVSAADLVTEYPFMRFNENDLVDMLSELERENLIHFENGFYRGL